MTAATPSFPNYHREDATPPTNDDAIRLPPGDPQNLLPNQATAVHRQRTWHRADLRVAAPVGSSTSPNAGTTPAAAPDPPGKPLERPYRPRSGPNTATGSPRTAAAHAAAGSSVSPSTPAAVSPLLRAPPPGTAPPRAAMSSPLPRLHGCRYATPSLLSAFAGRAPPPLPASAARGDRCGGVWARVR